MANEWHDPTKSFVARVIDWSMGNRFLVVLGALVVFVAGFISLRATPLDAIPDLTDTEVIVRTAWPGQAPQIVEDQITYPLATQMLGLPKIKVVRGFSMFGDSFVYAIFQDGTDMYWARSRVLEALSQISSQLPAGAKPRLGPDATGVGWVFQYALVDPTGHHDLQELRSLQDWFLRYDLETVKGVSEVASVGGFVKEYQILIDPKRLQSYGIPLTKVMAAVRAANKETGGGTLEMAETEYMIRAYGYVKNVDDLKSVVLTASDGTPVTVGDVARVIEGPAPRRGIAELDGKGETVGGIVIMRPGANPVQVIQDVKARIAALQKGLPEGVEIRTVYDRSALITGAVRYLDHKLLEESLVVALVTLLFLFHLRSAFVAIVTLPLGILAAFIVMHAQGLTANIMSLGGIAIAIGAMVDASVVMVENAHRKLSQLPPGGDRNAALLLAAKEVGAALFFSLLVITVSFLPVFALTGQSEKLFTPLAYTKTYAMAAASILSVTLVPVLMPFFVRGKIRPEEKNPLSRVFIALYRPVLNGALRFPKTVIVLAFAALLATSIPLTRTGSEFMPPLDEGSLLYMPMTVPGVSVTDARKILQITDRQIMTVPEVAHVFGKAGRSDSATDPAPLSMLETWIELKPRKDWRPGMTPEKLIAALDKRVRLPGLRNTWGYPIKIRTDMLTTGLRTALGVKISGPDLQSIDKAAHAVEALARKVPGTRSAVADRVQSGRYVEIEPDRRAIARYGISLETVQNVIQSALGGMVLDTSIESRARYPIALRYDRADREDLQSIENLMVPTADGAAIPLASLADIRIADGPAMITSEDAQLNGWVYIDVAGRDTGSYIADLQKRLQSLTLPTGCALHLAGQFEQMREANARLAVAIPATLLIILVLLYLHFGAWDRTLLVMLSVPFGLIGGFWSLWLAGYHLSVAAGVGFIALAGIAVETAIVMLIYLDQQMREHPPENDAALLDNVRHGAVLRLRPKLMTVSVVILGLVPVFLTDGPGADVIRRIALPMVGGMISTTILTLILIPVLYTLLQRRKKT
jgi:Cu(I)/Ag(I) efflux system membrane protein CusA/SilA